MKRLDSGYWIEFQTIVGEVHFSDSNGSHRIEVVTDGEFWRVVNIELPGAGILPAAARELASLLLKAADVAEQEERQIREQNDSAVECVYCGRLVREPDEIPEVSDSTKWSYLADEHANDCEWIATRANQVYR